MTAFASALQSGSILLREGLEALLVIAALAAFLRKAEAGGFIKWLYTGAIAAIAASFAGAVVLELYFGGMHDDRIEAVVMAVAAVLMLYMSGWLFLKQNPAAWTSDLKGAAERAISRGTALSMAAIAFLAVFREGAETVLFLHAAARTAGGWSVGLVGGIAAAAAILAVLFIAIEWLAVRLPLRPVFIATSAFLFVMGLRFVGAAIQECQEQVLVPVHGANLPQWLVDLGFNPSWEAIGTQVGVALIAIAGTLALQVYGKPRSAAAKSAAAAVPTRA